MWYCCRCRCRRTLASSARATQYLKIRKSAPLPSFKRGVLLTAFIAIHSEVLLTAFIAIHNQVLLTAYIAIHSGVLVTAYIAMYGECSSLST